MYVYLDFLADNDGLTECSQLHIAIKITAIIIRTAIFLFYCLLIFPTRMVDGDTLTQIIALSL